MDWPAAEALLAPLAPWFEASRRDLPWRSRDLSMPHPDPFAVLVSELMLQQTQVATVIPYFLRWMARFPNAHALAEAPEEEVLKLWEGLGYYRRARHLQATAKVIADTGWPGSLPELLRLPGLGPYTAAAVAAIAFQWPEPALDGNAFRVLARLLGLPGDPRLQAEALQTWLRPALAGLGPSRMTQALMELGATTCSPSRPRCGGCPVATACLARSAGATETIPPPRVRAKPKVEALLLVALEAEGAWLLQPPAAKGLLAGLWRWPALPTGEGHDTRPLPEGSGCRAFEGWTQVYTHRREQITPMHIRLEARRSAPAGMAWVPASRLATLPMGRRDQRLLALLGEASPIRAGAPLPGLLDRLFGEAG